MKLKEDQLASRFAEEVIAAIEDKRAHKVTVEICEEGDIEIWTYDKQGDPIKAVGMWINAEDREEMLKAVMEIVCSKWGVEFGE